MEDLMKKLHRLTVQQKTELTDEQIFSSKHFENYVQSFVDSTFLGTQYEGKVKVVYDYNDVAFGHTDGMSITINPILIAKSCYTSQLLMLKQILGVVFHECAHMLFMDFTGEAAGFRVIGDYSMLYSQRPVPRDSDEEASLLEIDAALHDPNMQMIIVEFMHEISNRIADQHDEQKIIDVRGKLVRECIGVGRNALQYNFSPLERLEADPMLTKLEVMYDLLLQLARFDEVIVLKDETLTKSEYYQTLRRVSRAVDMAKYTDVTADKFSAMNEMLMVFWPFVREEVKRQQNEQQQQQGGGQGSSSAPNMEQIAQNILKQMQKHSGPTSGNSTPTGNKTSQMAKDAAKDDKAGNNQRANGAKEAHKSGADSDPGSNERTESAEEAAASFGAESEQEAQDALDTIVSAIASENARDEAEKAATENLKQLLGAVSQNSTHNGVPRKIIRDLEISPEEERSYEAEYASIKLFSKKLQREMLKILRDLQIGEWQHHRLFGGKVEANAAYRLDRRFWAKKKLPQDLPDMAVSVLIDQSGSMYGQKLCAARRAALLLHDFCTGIGIPVHVAGHNTKGEAVQYFVYTDFDTLAARDKYRLMKLNANGSNRDGCAIEMCAARLVQRPEAIKMMVVLSDGLPNHTGYGGEEAEKDIQSICDKYHKQGLEIFGAAIDGDKEAIQNIYRETYVDFTDLPRLPENLVKLVQKRIIPH